MFVSIDGPDGVGKSTIINRLKEIYKDAVFVHEPGTTDFGQAMRKLLLNGNYNLCDFSEIMLFTACFIETSNKVIKPALSEGKLVIADRWYYSTAAYQIYANKYFDLTKYIGKFIHKLGISIPDYNILLTAPFYVLSQRLEKRNTETSNKVDNFEGRDIDYRKRIFTFYQKQCNGFHVSTNCDIDSTLGNIVGFIDSRDNHE
jgi:dTMP kinase